MLIIGLTGGIGSGKTTVSDFFASQGIVVVDSDVVARQVVAPGTPCLQAIADHFGTHLLLEDCTLDRSALKAIIFSDDEEKRWLEQLLHPAIQSTTETQLQQASSPYALLASPLLL